MLSNPNCVYASPVFVRRSVKHVTHALKGARGKVQMRTVASLLCTLYRCFDCADALAKGTFEKYNAELPFGADEAWNIEHALAWMHAGWEHVYTLHHLQSDGAPPFAQYV